MLNAYYLIEDGQQTGPFSHDELMDRGLAPQDLVLSPLINGWESAATLPEFADYFESQSYRESAGPAERAKATRDLERKDRVRTTSSLRTRRRVILAGGENTIMAQGSMIR